MPTPSGCPPAAPFSMPAPFHQPLGAARWHRAPTVSGRPRDRADRPLKRVMERVVAGAVARTVNGSATVDGRQDRTIVTARATTPALASAAAHWGAACGDWGIRCALVFDVGVSSSWR